MLKSLRGFNAAVQCQKEKPGDASAFSRARKLLIKKEPTFLGGTQLDDPSILNRTLGLIRLFEQSLNT